MFLDERLLERCKQSEQNTIIKHINFKTINKMKNLEEYYKDNLKGIKVGDKVFDLAYGHGVVYAMRRKNPPYYYRIKVKFDVGRLNEYTKNGCVHTCYPIPILFFDKPTYDKDGYPIPQQKEENWKNILTK